SHVFERHVLRTSATAPTSATIQLDPWRPSARSAPTSTTMSPAAFALAQRLALDLEELTELSKREPAAADRLVGSLVSHLWAFRPESVSPLGELPSPDEIARDPRGAR
ncbi:MAG TPA: hypothetical protein VF469_15845, partial [Kofleriaceae bacterium]